MGICGGLIILVVLLWQGRLLTGIRQGWNFLLNWLLCRPFDPNPPPPSSAGTTTIPYGVAIAFGMAGLCWRLA